MNQIKISLSNFSIDFTNIEINLDKAEIRVNDKIKKCNKSDISKIFMSILEMTQNWNELYMDNSILDGMHFSLTIECQDEIKSYQGKGGFPSNFNDFVNLIQYIRSEVE